MVQNQKQAQRSNIQTPTVVNHASPTVDIKGKPESANQIEIGKTHGNSQTVTEIRIHDLDDIDRSDNDRMPVTRPRKRFFEVNRDVAETLSAKLVSR